MAYFKCDKCGNTLEAETPPETCPACSQKCSFVDVTCYTPECGGADSENINPNMLNKENATDQNDN